MHAVVRNYSGKGAKELADILEQNKADVEKTLRGAKGFVGYTLARTDEGCVSVTVCEDKAGTETSMTLAREWISKHAGTSGVGAPHVSEGSVIIHA